MLETKVESAESFLEDWNFPRTQVREQNVISEFGSIPATLQATGDEYWRIFGLVVADFTKK